MSRTTENEPPTRAPAPSGPSALAPDPRLAEVTTSWARWRDLVVSRVRRRGSFSEEAAEDAYADAIESSLLRIKGGDERVRVGDDFHAWLTTAAMRIACHQRRRHGARERPLEAGDVTQPEGMDRSLIEEIPTPDQEVFRQQVREALDQELERLSASQVHGLVRHDGCGETFEAIGRDIGVKPATVNRSAQEARRALARSPRLRELHRQLLSAGALLLALLARAAGRSERAGALRRRGAYPLVVAGVAWLLLAPGAGDSSDRVRLDSTDRNARVLIQPTPKETAAAALGQAVRLPDLPAPLRPPTAPPESARSRARTSAPSPTGSVAPPPPEETVLPPESASTPAQREQDARPVQAERPAYGDGLALLRHARLALDSGDNATASLLFEEYLARFPDGELGSSARRGLLAAERGLGDWDGVAATADALLAEGASGQEAAELTIIRASALAQAGRCDELRALQESAGDARLALRRLARQCGRTP